MRLYHAQANPHTACTTIHARANKYTHLDRGLVTLQPNDLADELAVSYTDEVKHRRPAHLRGGDDCAPVAVTRGEPWTQVGREGQRVSGGKGRAGGCGDRVGDVRKGEGVIDSVFDGVQIYVQCAQLVNDSCYIAAIVATILFVAVLVAEGFGA